MKKKVVLEVGSNIVSINDVNSDKIYAAYNLNLGHCLYITANEEGYYTTWIYADQLFDSCYGPYDNIQKVISEMVEDGLIVYEFDTELEVSEWIKETCESF